jgi:outer membrane immunogenic protein
MKKLLLASSALMAISGPAFAIPPAPFSWTGFYIGGNVGAGWDRTTYSDPGNPAFGGMPVIIQNIAPFGSSFAVNGGAGALGGVDTYRIHKTMAARVTTAR